MRKCAAVQPWTSHKYARSRDNGREGRQLKFNQNYYWKLTRHSVFEPLGAVFSQLLRILSFWKNPAEITADLSGPHIIIRYSAVQLPIPGNPIAELYLIDNANTLRALGPTLWVCSTFLDLSRYLFFNSAISSPRLSELFCVLLQPTCPCVSPHVETPCCFPV